MNGEQQPATLDPPEEGSAPSRAVDAMLAEYETLRQESLESIGHRMTVVTFTFAILGAVIGGLLTRKVSDVLAGLIAIAFLPQAAKAALLMWLGEYERSRRAGKAIAELEGRINTAVGVKALSWESQLWEKQTRSSGRAAAHMDYPYVAVIVFLLGAAYTALALGTYLLFVPAKRHWGHDSAVGVAVGISVVAVVVEATFIRYFHAWWTACRSRDG